MIAPASPHRFLWWVVKDRAIRTAQWLGWAIIITVFSALGWIASFLCYMALLAVWAGIVGIGHGLLHLVGR